ncbi:hypothetical protein Syun_027536 [Stephania yunnanensis]|uniref:Uncharacterized protein n=1 Tax=Stephania yunnanensis TaxID=152371 RepID=A0AAP0HRC5_9MAGN
MRPPAITSNMMEQLPLLLASPLPRTSLLPCVCPLSGLLSSRRPSSAAATSSALSLRPRSHSSVRAFSPSSSLSPPYIALRIMYGHGITSNPVTPTSPTPVPYPCIPSETDAEILCVGFVSGRRRLRRLHKLGRNVAEAIANIKSSLSLDSVRCDSPISSGRGAIDDLCLAQLYPETHLPAKLASNIRKHFDSFPLREFELVCSVSALAGRPDLIELRRIAVVMRRQSSTSKTCFCIRLIEQAENRRPASNSSPRTSLRRFRPGNPLKSRPIGCATKRVSEDSKSALKESPERYSSQKFVDLNGPNINVDGMSNLKSKVTDGTTSY